MFTCSQSWECGCYCLISQQSHLSHCSHRPRAAANLPCPSLHQVLSAPLQPAAVMAVQLSTPHNGTSLQRFVPLLPHSPLRTFTHSRVAFKLHCHLVSSHHSSKLKQAAAGRRLLIYAYSDRHAVIRSDLPRMAEQLRCSTTAEVQRNS